MKDLNKFFLVITFFVLLNFPSKADSETLTIGKPDAKVIVKVFSSLTCPHCASFHNKIFENLKKDYIDNGNVRFEHHAFPLDLAALNAELIVRCHINNEKSFHLLGEIYEKQNIWAVGSDINPINESIKKIGLKSGLKEEKMKKCISDEVLQNQILNERIQAQKKYNIQSTPTIIINEKKYEDKHEYKSFKKAIEKNL